MIENFGNFILTEESSESLESLRVQEKKASEEYERLAEILELNSTSPELRDSVNEAYNRWHEIKRKIAQLEGDKQNQ